jgi:hypothetical protein
MLDGVYRPLVLEIKKGTPFHVWMHAIGGTEDKSVDDSFIHRIIYGLQPERILEHGRISNRSRA